MGQRAYQNNAHELVGPNQLRWGGLAHLHLPPSPPETLPETLRDAKWLCQRAVSATLQTVHRRPVTLPAPIRLSYFSLLASQCCLRPTQLELEGPDA